jgi:hypothetical protein
MLDFLYPSPQDKTLCPAVVIFIYSLDIYIYIYIYIYKLPSFGGRVMQERFGYHWVVFVSVRPAEEEMALFSLTITLQAPRMLQKPLSWWNNYAQRGWGIMQ